MKKTNFDNKLTSFNRQITSNKTKYVEVRKRLNTLNLLLLECLVRKRLNTLITKDFDFFFDRVYFTSIDGSQNNYAYQQTLDTLEFKKDKGTVYIFRWKSNSKMEVKLIKLL